MIIHISGASGSGKTTLGNKIKAKFKNKIVVKDLDELLDEYLNDAYGVNHWTYNDINEDAYQTYINQYVQKHQSRPIVFVGLNDNLVDFFPKRKNMYYDVSAQHKFYIDIDLSKNVKQKCLRYLDNVQGDAALLDTLVNNNPQFIKTMTTAINTECNAKFIKKWSDKWKNNYKRQGYVLATSDEIYDRVVNLITGAIGKSKVGKRKQTTRKARRLHHRQPSTRRSRH